ncbi:pyridoxal-dependent decarboxylase [Candidatus Paracaedibacter symbiosus]|uniref:pyridoxal-dependent decarboxylase n=1 Tax=Candidatus Paracaedibacter symbiosus TaxID=244582 RepID=UPI000509AC00|nr:pyridoxal-dependent decarboxylase [Candidatus Paracaedibacter symbiosus]
MPLLLPTLSADIQEWQKEYLLLHQKAKHYHSHKLGYPVSLMASLYNEQRGKEDIEVFHEPGLERHKIINNSVLGILPGSLAEMFLVNVGDPRYESNSHPIETKKIERDVIEIMTAYLGLSPGKGAGYVTAGGTEANFAGLWWSRRYLLHKNEALIQEISHKIKAIKQKPPFDQPWAIDETNDHAELLDKNKAFGELYSLEQIYKQLLYPSIFFTETHTHCSIFKIAQQLCLDCKPVKAQEDGSMDIASLTDMLKEHKAKNSYNPVIVVANAGTTVMGAIDDITAINTALRQTLTSPCTYTIHMDGALNGFILPLLKPFGEVDDYFQSIGVRTIAISAHKFLGTQAICGMILTTQEFLEHAFPLNTHIIDYIGDIADITFSGCRSGLNIMLLHNAMCSLGLHQRNYSKLRSLVKRNFENARYLSQKLKALLGDKEVLWKDGQFNVLFKRPSPRLIVKYNLMPASADHVAACVLQNVTRSLIDKFIDDYQTELTTGLCQVVEEE